MWKSRHLLRRGTAIKIRIYELNMLKGIHPALSPDLLKTMAGMGLSGYQYLSGAEGWSSPGVGAWDNGYVPETGQLTNKVAFIETYGSASTLSLSQLVTGFTIGQVYELSYYENGRAHPAVNTTTAETFVGGASVVAAHLVTPVNSLNQYTNPFYYRTALFTATATQMDLEFRATKVGVNDTFLAC
jgi:hypothetical protein